MKKRADFFYNITAIQLYCAIINYLRNLPKSGYSTHKGSFFAWISHVYKYLSVVHTFLTCQLLCAQAAKSCAHAKRRSRKYCARTLAPLGLFGISFRRADTRLISAGMPVSARSTPSSPNPHPRTTEEPIHVSKKFLYPLLYFPATRLFFILDSL